MNMHINNQSDEIRRLGERVEDLEGRNKSLELAWDIAFDEAKREQKRNDDLTAKLFWSLALNVAFTMAVVGLVMR